MPESSPTRSGRSMRKIRLKSPLNARLAAQLERELNDSQREAATAPGGYNLILAGPGSGKTRVITYRVAHLIASGVPPGSIMLVTFTRRAAREMVRRMESLVGQQAAHVWAGTFHHIGNRLLRRAATLLGYQDNFTILDSEDQLDLIKLAMDDAALDGNGQACPQGLFDSPSDQLCRQRESAPGRVDRRAKRRARSVAGRDRSGRHGLRRAQAHGQLHGL